MDFIKYSSLTNVSEREVNRMKECGLTDGKFVATEKIHGTNLSVVLRHNIKPIWCRRESPIAPGEQFYQYESIAKCHKWKLQDLFDFLVESGYATIDSVIQVYGEYAGSHEDGSRVQKQIEYGPIEWYVFDIKVNGIYLTPQVVFAAMLAVDMKSVPVLTIGTFEECLAVPNDLQSVVMRANESHEITITPGTDNIAEGTVIRRWDAIQYFPNGRLAVLKNKNTKFKGKKTPTVVVVKELSESDSVMLAEAKSYLTKPRLDNVLSHIGNNLTDKDFGRIMGMFAQDAMKAFEADTERMFFEMFDDPTRCKRMFMTEASALLREVWMDILEK